MLIEMRAVRARRAQWDAIALCVVACSWGGCTPSLDVLGRYEADIVEVRQDQLLSDKMPLYDAERTIEETFDGCTFRVNKSASVTRLSLGEFGDDVRALQGRIFANRGDALKALGDRPVIPSMEAINGALKPFNDGLYAAVELAAERGESGSLVDKRAAFDALLGAMLSAAEAGDADARTGAVQLAAAARLADPEFELAAAYEDDVADALRTFEAEPVYSEPIGFYTWTPELERIFRRDRFLQRALEESHPFEVASVAALALHGDSELLDEYRRVLELYSGLTNPSRHLSPVELVPFSDALESDPDGALAQVMQQYQQLGSGPCDATFSWLPASDSPERKLLSELSCSGQAVDNPLDAFISAIQDGRIDLEPSKDSGWYDWQLYTLETLVAPEKAPENERLLLTQEYKDKLVETFKSLLIQTRETHAKQLEAVSASSSATAPTVDVYPLLPLEPFPTFYLRTARGYAFLHNVLRASMGPEFLAESKRLQEDGSDGTTALEDELTQKTELLYGLHLVAAASIGMAPGLSPEELSHYDADGIEAAARAWLEGWEVDADVRKDPRVSVPLIIDTESETMTHVAVVGVKWIRMHASFPEGREPEFESQGFCSRGEIVPFEPYMLVEQTLTYETPLSEAPLTRDALRMKLDGCGSLEEMREALEGPQ